MKNLRCGFLVFLLVNQFILAQDRITGEPFATRSVVCGQNGMVATSHPLATQIGLDILKQGGNAIDAAIASNAALGLMEPTGCGIGGDLFAIVWDGKTQKLYGLNASIDFFQVTHSNNVFRNSESRVGLINVIYVPKQNKKNNL